ncbi:MAG: hypothetical protein KJ709_09005 [Nanoarchaeota archaeon]|nr:hypothetical protein [Nanoarchaeota archaeon]
MKENQKFGRPPVDFNPIEVTFGPDFVNRIKEFEVKDEFPFLSDTSDYMPSGNPLRVVGVELEENPPYSIITQAVHHIAGLSARGNIQVIGGAAGFELGNIPTMDELLKGLEGRTDLPDGFRHAREIYRAANDLDANIITGGTQSGVMALISSMYVADYILNSRVIEAASLRARLLQEDPLRVYDGKGPALFHIVPGSATIFPGNEQVKKENWPSPLAPCTGFISVNGGKGWGEEGSTLEKSSYVTSFIPAYDHAVASLPRFDQQYSSRVALVMNGGPLTILEAKRALHADYPATLLILKGTGRFADLLATSVENEYALPSEDHPIWDLGRIKEDYSKGDYAKEFGIVLDYLRNNPSRANIFIAGNEGLTSRIRSLMTRTPL